MTSKPMKDAPNAVSTAPNLALPSALKKTLLPVKRLLKKSDKLFIISTTVCVTIRVTFYKKSVKKFPNLDSSASDLEDALLQDD